MDYPIVTGSVQNPYREFTYTIPAGQTQQVFYDLDYFRILSASITNFQVRFGQTGAFSSMQVGLGYSLPDAVRNVFITNTDVSNPLTILIAVAVGKIDDSRFTASGTVTTQETKAATLSTVADVALTDSTATLISAASSTRREIHINNLTANGVAMRIGDINVGPARGIPLDIGGTYIISTSAAVYGYIVGTGKKAAVTAVSD